MIALEHVHRRYGARLALSDVSLTIQPGEVTLLLGANGAGKSTLLRCVLGVSEYEGEIRVLGLDPRTDGRAVRAQIGYMPQADGLHRGLTVRETLRFYADLRGVAAARCQTLLDEAGLASHASARVEDLSGGLRQRLGFAVALLTDPPILVLDEPTASLDVGSRTWLSERLRAAAAAGRVVLLSTHAGQDLLAAGDRMIRLEEGRVTADDRRGAPGPLATAREAPAARRDGAGRLIPLVRKELKDAVTSRWLIGYAVVLGALGAAAAASGVDGASGLALQAFGRTTATLMNLCLLLAPLVAVLMGAASVAGERERGTLDHLLAQPLTPTGVLLAKHAALLLSLAAATLAGFVPAGAFIVSAAGPAVLGHYLIFPTIAVLVAVAMAGVGLLISVAARSAVQAQGAAVFAWFGFVLLYDLLLIGTLAMSGLPVQALAAALVANPVDAARVLGVLALEPDLYLLGPAGAFLTGELGRPGAALVLLGSLLFWSVAPMSVAVYRFAAPHMWWPRRASHRRAERPGTVDSHPAPAAAVLARRSVAPPVGTHKPARVA